MESVVGQTFRNEDLVLDATQKFYVNCKFTQCRFVYMGGDSPFVNCHFDAPNVHFAGEAAKVLGFMQSMGMIQQIPPPPPQALQQMPDSGATH